MSRPRIVVVGAGFAGLNCLRRLERRVPRGSAELVLVTPQDYQLYQPLLPQVASGLVTPQSISVSLHRLLHQTRMVPGFAVGVDVQARAVLVRTISGALTSVRYDRLVLAPGSRTRQFPIPGLTEHAVGNKTLAEAVYLRDHVLAQLELANASDDPAEREERCRFVVVGGGYTGVETAASLELLCEEGMRRYPRLRESVDWHLVDVADRLMPELGQNLGDDALNLLRSRGIRVSLGVSVREVSADKVTLTDGRVLPSRTLIWAAGTEPSPLMAATGLPTQKGKLTVGSDLATPSHPEVFALGDSAAVPDMSSDDGALCPPTAQAASRQGPVAADNVIASLLGRPTRSYRYRDLGLLVDLSGRDAVAKPLGIDLTGTPALALTRGYHLYALASGPARARVAANWAIRTAFGGEVSRLGFLSGSRAAMGVAEETECVQPDEARRQIEQLSATDPNG
ncbi:FAD-dependent oxidoreductase [Lipingzhangella sp. LS1_29]|uniref:FAD-dependent oxidoreductase n=1 Tax=Lipingzhangella rawalii TaxID=2055835 RepID=A0ABU2H2P7_9ACTN|nr:FAD-dependent oxidoreductase [Lipingzhangella rawalii]MDS1269577.1 FAD-dependent oxidoreductase [Lipingzhangella rawalii]